MPLYRVVEHFRGGDTEDQSLLEDCMQQRADSVEFEVHPVMTSQEPVRRVAPRLQP